MVVVSYHRKKTEVMTPFNSARRRETPDSTSQVELPVALVQLVEPSPSFSSL